MTKDKFYQYTSKNGSVFTSVDLEIGEPAVFYQLGAEKGKILTNGSEKIHYVTVHENEVSFWKEILENEDSTPKDEGEEIDYKKLLDIITGDSE